jgi:LysM repeat protein
MYIAYSNSNDNSMNHTFQSVQSMRKIRNKRANLMQLPKKAIRFIVALLVLTLVFSFGAFVQAYAGNADSVKSNSITNAGSSTVNTVLNEGRQPVKIVVNAGDTLWDIASMHVSNEQNIRSYITNIKKLNGLASSSIKEGDVLILP